MVLEKNRNKIHKICLNSLNRTIVHCLSQEISKIISDNHNPLNKMILTQHKNKLHKIYNYEVTNNITRTQPPKKLLKIIYNNYNQLDQMSQINNSQRMIKILMNNLYPHIKLVLT